MAVVKHAPATIYVIAASPLAAEQFAEKLPRNAPRAETAEQAFMRWSNQPDIMRRTYRLYGVRVRVLYKAA